MKRVMVALLAASVAGAQDAVVHAGALLDPTTGRIARDQLIVVRAGKIAEITTAPSDFSRPAGVAYHDLTRFTVLPGLIDGHVHLGIGGPVRDNALAALRAGFTTVVDLGARTQRLLRIRDSINAGQIPGPRTLAAGIWIGAKNGVCEFGGIGIAGGPEGFGQRAKENIEGGADLTKVCVSGWPAESFTHPDSVHITADALRAAVAESRSRGKPVVAHALSRAGVEMAVEAGVNGLAHAAFLDGLLTRRMRAANMFMMPTLASLTGGDTSLASRRLISATRGAWSDGVTIVFGTDGGVLPHGRNGEEFAALVNAGLTSLAAIQSATVNAARAFGITAVTGAVRPGLSADIIAVEGDPLRDITAMSRVRFVMLRGAVVDSAGARR